MKLAFVTLALVPCADCLAHGTVVFPMSRVYRVRQSNPERPNFELARRAVAIDGKQSYYTWNELSRVVPQAVRQRLPPGFDYSPWIPDGQLASAGRVDRRKMRTYAGLDQVSADWPKTPAVAGRTITVDFFATAPHFPSVWDVWITKSSWRPNTPLRWSEMEFLGRPKPTYANRHFKFDVKIPADRRGHHVLWIVWQRDDPAGEAFFSTSDIDVRPAASFETYGNGCDFAQRSQPTLRNLSLPTLGRGLQLEVDNATRGAFAALLLGTRTDVAFGPCRMFARPDGVLPIGVWNGRTITVLGIPDDARLLGVRLATQAVLLDRHIALTNGGEAAIGL